MIFANTLCWVSLTTAISLQAAHQPIETEVVDRPSSSDTEIWQQIMSEEESARRLPRKRVAARAAADQGPSTVISIHVPTSTTSKRAAATPAAALGPLPSPMDSMPVTFSDDTSGKCPAFIQSFLADNTFKSCYPFAMLLQVSLKITQQRFPSEHTKLRHDVGGFKQLFRCSEVARQPYPVPRRLLQGRCQKVHVVARRPGKPIRARQQLWRRACER